jgi:cell division GTPase FtsZ
MLTLKQRAIIDCMTLPQQNDNEIQITKEDIRQVLSLGNISMMDTVKSLEELRSKIKSHKKFSGVILLFEIPATQSLLILSEWIETVQNHMVSNASFILGTKSSNHNIKVHLVCAYTEIYDQKLNL